MIEDNYRKKEIQEGKRRGRNEMRGSGGLRRADGEGEEEWRRSGSQYISFITVCLYRNDCS